MITWSLPKTASSCCAREWFRNRVTVVLLGTAFNCWVLRVSESTAEPGVGEVLDTK